jgi:subtilisin family serine protease
VAVLDTGVDLNHPALTQRLVPGYDFVDLDADPSEVGVYGQDQAYGHGTHVAGLVALVAPDAKLMPIRVLDANGVGTVWGLTQAMAYAIDPDQDPRTADGASIINLSMSMGRHTTILKKLLRVAEAKNVVVVAAAGNTGTSKPEYPAAEKVPNKLAVAASTPMGALADFSTYGRWVDVAAPGTDVLSSVLGGIRLMERDIHGDPARLRDSSPAQGEQPHAGGDCSHSRDASGYRESRC